MNRPADIIASAAPRYTCPTCHAGADERCYKMAGRYHVARLRAAEADLAPERIEIAGLVAVRDAVQPDATAYSYAVRRGAERLGLVIVRPDSWGGATAIREWMAGMGGASRREAQYFTAREAVAAFAA